MKNRSEISNLKLIPLFIILHLPSSGFAVLVVLGAPFVTFVVHLIQIANYASSSVITFPPRTMSIGRLPGDIRRLSGLIPSW